MIFIGTTPGKHKAYSDDSNLYFKPSIERAQNKKWGKKEKTNV